MYCSNCGAKAEGKFCAECGSRIASPPTEATRTDGWDDEVRYSVLLNFGEVRDHIARHSAQSRDAFSGEDFLDLCDMAFKPLIGFNANKMGRLLAPVYDKLGLRTERSRTEVVRRPVGRTLVAAICSLARHGRTIKQVHQGDDGCVLEAVMPPGFRALKGEMVISIARSAEGTRVEAAAKIPGQVYDWGKTDKCLDELMDDVRRLCA
jgi:hypothetical protein